MEAQEFISRIAVLFDQDDVNINDPVAVQHLFEQVSNMTNDLYLFKCGGVSTCQENGDYQALADILVIPGQNRCRTTLTKRRQPGEAPLSLFDGYSKDQVRMMKEVIRRDMPEAVTIMDEPVQDFIFELLDYVTRKD